MGAMMVENNKRLHVSLKARTGVFLHHACEMMFFEQSFHKTKANTKQVREARKNLENIGKDAQAASRCAFMPQDLTHLVDFIESNAPAIGRRYLVFFPKKIDIYKNFSAAQIMLPSTSRGQSGHPPRLKKSIVSLFELVSHFSLIADLQGKHADSFFRGYAAGLLGRPPNDVERGIFANQRLLDLIVWGNQLGVSGSAGGVPDAMAALLADARANALCLDDSYRWREELLSRAPVATKISLPPLRRRSPFAEVRMVEEHG